MRRGGGGEREVRPVKAPLRQVMDEVGRTPNTSDILWAAKQSFVSPQSPRSGVKIADGPPPILDRRLGIKQALADLVVF